MDIIKISPQGFCQGVNYALNIVNKTIESDCQKPIYLLGNIIHNKIAMDELKNKGVIIISSTKPRYDMLDEIETGTVIFSAHGVSPRVYEKAKHKGLNIVDATCPNVLLIHKKIIDRLNDYEIIYIGTKNHPECEGVLEISNKIHLVTSISDVKNLNITSNNIYVTNQTTLSIYDIKNIFDAIKTKFPNALIDNKICMATTKRQEALINLKNVDICLVVGDKTSSNSKKLAHVAQNIANVTSYLIESVKDINPDWFENTKTIAVTSGASTPDYVTNEVINYLKKNYS